jgi:purine-binding chemotaxis protein CheW
MEELKALEARKFLTFRLGAEEYGIDIRKITTIIEKEMAIARVPKTPDYLKGVINLRGEIIPVMSLRKRFSVEEIEYTEETRIIIVKIEEITIGLIVDAVSEVIEFEDESIESISNIGGLTTEYILGVGKKDGRIVTLLSLEKLIGIEE